MRIFVIPTLLLLGAASAISLLQNCTESTDCDGYPTEFCDINMCMPTDVEMRPFSSHDNFAGAVFDKTCTKHEDCKGSFPVEWCRANKCVIMPPIKESCTQNSECSKAGEECYKNRCVEKAAFGFHNEFVDIPLIQKCTAATECKNFPRELCINNNCVWKPPGMYHFHDDSSSEEDESHDNFAGPFDKSCTKHEDCEKPFPDHWCRGNKCVTMPPIKQTCTKDSECPKAGEQCYKKRCVEKAFHRSFANFSGTVGHQHNNFVELFAKSCAKNEDCKGAFPVEWCRASKCVIMPPIKESCTQNSDCPMAGEECYQKRCVEKASAFNHEFVDVPLIQKCTAATECKNFPRELCINSNCVWKPPGMYHFHDDSSSEEDESHDNFAGPFDKTCTKHEDCEKPFPDHWCRGNKCVTMPPIKQTCTKDSECPKAGEQCYKKRCVEKAFRRSFANFSGTVGHQHLNFVELFAKSCAKNEDCKGAFPVEWCRASKCVIMPPIKETCTQNSDCPKAGEECYQKRCVEKAAFAPHNDFADIPLIQKCTAATECKNFPRELCINNNCVWKPPGMYHFHDDSSTEEDESHDNFAGPFDKSCTKHEDCEKPFPDHWCRGNKCVTMPPIKQTCTEDSECPKAGEQCYKKRCVEKALHRSFANFSGTVGHHHQHFAELFAKSCTKNEDCKGAFPVEWCRASKCVIMPPIKETCTQNSECPKAGEECYQKRCVEKASALHNEFVNVPLIQKCTAATECKNFPRELCINNNCVWKPPGMRHFHDEFVNIDDNQMIIDDSQLLSRDNFAAAAERICTNHNDCAGASPAEWCQGVTKDGQRTCVVKQKCETSQDCSKPFVCYLGACTFVDHNKFVGSFEKTCTKHEDCKGPFPVEWCRANKCVTMPPIKESCTQNSDCPKAGEECYKNRCVEKASKFVDDEGLFGFGMPLGRDNTDGPIRIGRGYPLKENDGTVIGFSKRSQCGKSSDCGGSHVCTRGRCVYKPYYSDYWWRANPNRPCTDSSQCTAPAFCVKGRCKFLKI